MGKKVADLEGAELDYWVARALGLDAEIAPHPVVRGINACVVNWDDGPLGVNPIQYEPHRDWREGGPIIERLDFDLLHDPEGSRFAGVGQRGASLFLPSRPGEVVTVDYLGPTYLIAAMRCVVASKFGEEVDV